MTNLTMHIVATYTAADGTTQLIDTADALNVRVPRSITRRRGLAHSIGLDYVRGLQNSDTNIVAVTISTTVANHGRPGRMALASWRVMPTMSTPNNASFTGTNDVHPLIAAHMHGRTFGQWLNARLTRAESE